MQHMYVVPNANTTALAECLTKLNAKCQKLSVTPFHYYWTSYAIGYTALHLEAEQPKLSGWSFVAAITHTADGNIVRTVPGVTGQPNWHSLGPDCNHCELGRKRNHTFIVAHDGGTLKQVGRSCLADFTGHANPHAIAKYAEMLTIVNEACNAGTVVKPSGDLNDKQPIVKSIIDLKAYLARVAYVIGTHGWVSKKQAAQSMYTATGPVGCTADMAYEQMFAPVGTFKQPTQECVEEAERTIAWVEGLEESPSHEATYEDALKAIIGCGSNAFNRKHCALVASAVQSQRLYVDKLIALEVASQQLHKYPPTPTNEYIGKIDDAISGVFYIREIKPYLTNQGKDGSLVILADEQGRVAKVFCNPGYVKLAGVKPNTFVKLDGNVALHNIWKGYKETILRSVSIYTDD